MSDGKSHASGAAGDARQRRMAEALRANLRRRKEQSRDQAREKETDRTANAPDVSELARDGKK